MDMTDPNLELRLTGENPILTLFTDPEQPATTTANFWRLLISPAGPGHALFLRSEITENEPRIYTDNIAAARWLQREILANNRTSPFMDEGIEARDAEFTREGDVRSFITERIDTDEETVLLTWYDFLEPFPIWVQPSAERVHGTSAIFVPALGSQLTIDGVAAPGKPLPRERDGRPSSSSFIAWSETWLRPRG